MPYSFVCACSSAVVAALEFSPRGAGSPRGAESPRVNSYRFYMVSLVARSKHQGESLHSPLSCGNLARESWCPCPQLRSCPETRARFALALAVQILASSIGEPRYICANNTLYNNVYVQLLRCVNTPFPSVTLYPGCSFPLRSACQLSMRPPPQIHAWRSSLTLAPSCR